MIYVKNIDRGDTTYAAWSDVDALPADLMLPLALLDAAAGEDFTARIDFIGQKIARGDDVHYHLSTKWRCVTVRLQMFGKNKYTISVTQKDVDGGELS